jgi:hypothetical protein
MVSWADYREGNILVEFNDQATGETAHELINSIKGLEFLSAVYPSLKVGVVNVPVGKEQYWIDIFAKESIIKYAELNHIMVIALVGAPKPAQDYAPGEIIVGFYDNVTKNEANALVESHNLTWRTVNFPETFDFWVKIVTITDEVIKSKGGPTAEICGNGIDDDCDMQVDEGCVDVDNDGIDDSVDRIIGSASDMDTNIIKSIKVDDVLNPLTAENMSSVEFMDENSSPVIEFAYDFDDNVLDLSQISVNNDEINNLFVIRNINLGEGLTKTVVLDRINESINAVCILDEENITSISEDCSAQDEFLVKCDDNSVNGYNCSILNGTKLEVSGLKHSGIRQIVIDEVQGVLEEIHHHHHTHARIIYQYPQQTENQTQNSGSSDGDSSLPVATPVINIKNKEADTGLQQETEETKKAGYTTMAVADIEPEKLSFPFGILSILSLTAALILTVILMFGLKFKK